MKTTLALSLLLLATAACGDDDDSAPAQPGPTPSATTAPPAPPPPPVARTMGTARAMGTRPENLVLDPTFGSFGSMYAQAVLTQDATGYVDTPATSPAGPAQPVLVVAPKGGQPLVQIAVQAGTGPLHVRLFLATKDAKAPEVSLIAPDGLSAFDILPSATGAEKHGDRTYQLYTAYIDEATFGRLYFIVQPAAAELAIAAPEVTSPAAPSTMSRSRMATRRAPNAVEKRAAEAIRARPVFRGALPRPTIHR